MVSALTAIMIQGTWKELALRLPISAVPVWHNITIARVEVEDRLVRCSPENRLHRLRSEFAS
jgi:hypothetical protein